MGARFAVRRWSRAVTGVVTLVALLACGGGQARAAFPGANGKVAFVAETTDVSDAPQFHLQIWTVNSDGNGATQLTHDDTADAEHPVFSPDGTKIAYEDDGGHVYVMNADGSNPVDLTPSAGGNITYDRPAWSPDGTKLAVLYRNQADASPEYDVAVISATTPSSAVTNLTAGVGADSGTPGEFGSGPAWSPDGSKIAFIRGNPAEVWVMNASDGSNPHVITTVSNAAAAPAWSPNSSKIVFDSSGQLFTANPSASSPGQTQLTASSAQVNEHADFSPDGSEIVDQTVSTSSGAITIAILNADGTGSRNLTSGPTIYGGNHIVDEPDWQPAAAAHLTVTPAGSGSGTVTSSPAGISCPGTCAFPYAPNTKVTLTAAAGSGSYFAGWSGGGCSGTATTCQVTVTADTTVTATFNAGYLLAVKPSPDLGMDIRSVPAGIACGTGSTGTCAAIFPAGAFVTLNQYPTQTGVLFTGWSGGGCAGIQSCTLQMTAAKTVAGSWAYIPPQVTGTHAVGPLAFTVPGPASYVGTEWTGYLTAVDCVSSSLCVASGYMRDSATIAHKGIVSTNTSFGFNGNWTAGVPDSDFNWAPPGDQWQLQDISCAGTSFCGAVDDQGDVFATNNPALGADSFGPSPKGVWQKTLNLDPIGNYSYHETEAIACPAANECAVIDADGGLLSSTNTSGGAGTWTRQSPPSQGSPTSISCPGPASCYIATATGDILKSLTSGSVPAVGGPYTASSIDPGNELDHLTCVQGDCFATDLSGNLWSSTTPDAGASAWKHVNLGNVFLTAIGCASPTFCVVGDNSGDVFVSRNPTGSASDWTSARVLPSDGIDGISCNSTLIHLEGSQTWCVAIADDGRFVEGMLPVLSVARVGTGSGTVSSSTTLNCGTSCSTVVPAGTTVTLTATPSTSSAFSAWSSLCTSTSASPLSCTVKLDHPLNTQVDAVFSPTPVTTTGGLTLSGTGATTTISCTSTPICSGTVLVAPATGLRKLARDVPAATKARTTGNVLGIGSFRIKSHHRRVVRIRLTRAGKRMAKHHHLRSARLTITIKQPKHRRLVAVRTVRVRY